MRAVEFARKYQVVIHSRSAFSDAEGTYIKEETDMMEEAVITGIAHDTYSACYKYSFAFCTLANLCAVIVGIIVMSIMGFYI